jgi:hypothetical protein
MVILCYFKLYYHKLFVAIILMAINGYSINGYWWVFYYNLLLDILNYIMIGYW